MSQTQMPKPAHYKALKDILTIDEAVEHPEVLRRFQAALGDKLDAGQYLSTIRGMVKENPLFAKVDVWELVRCALDLAELGLRPNTPFGHAYIIPREKFKGKPNAKVELSIMLGYQGLLELAWRANVVESIFAAAVCEGDDFDFAYGTDGFLKHRPRGPRDNDKIIEFYAYAKLKGGGESFVVWDKEDVNKIRARSDAYNYAMSQDANSYSRKTPWLTDYVSMGNKSVLKQLLKVLPKSAEFLAYGIQLDGVAESSTISYPGAPGEMKKGQQAISHQQTVPLDLGMKPRPTVNADVVDLRDREVADAKPQQQRQEPTQQERQQRQEPPKEREPEQVQEEKLPERKDPPAQLAGLSPTPLSLISADGEVMLEETNLEAWAKEFVQHLRDVPPDMLEAYGELNQECLYEAYRWPPAAALLKREGYAPPADVTKPTTGPLAFPIEPANGRPDLKAYSAIVRASLVGVETREALEAWREEHDPELRKLSTTIRVAMLQTLAAHAREVGIDLSQPYES
jgi:phage RecT family recombinase